MANLSLVLLLLLSTLYPTIAFHSFPSLLAFRPSKISPLHAATVSTQPVPKADPSSVLILPDAAAVSSHIQSIVTQAAQKAIADRGHFALAIPGGSILKMLVNLSSASEWASKTTMVYVNHKCVPMDDEKLATHAKAQKLFLKEWEDLGLHTMVLDGTSDGEVEATRYEDKLRALDELTLPRNSQGLPQFDLALIGVGDDGHVGSLYPNREEVLVDETGPWVLPVSMKDPPSITLSLPLMQAASRVIVAACGVSDKYPQGKSAGMKRAIVEEETLTSFPAVGLRSVATWVMDEAAASKLGPEYVAK